MVPKLLRSCVALSTTLAFAAVAISPPIADATPADNVSHFLDTGCGDSSPVNGIQLADSAPDAETLGTSPVSPDVSATSTPAVPQIPLARPAGGPGILLIPLSTPSPSITPPPVPTPTPTVDPSAHPVVLTRDTPEPTATPLATPTPAINVPVSDSSSGTSAATSASNAATSQTAPAASGSVTTVEGSAPIPGSLSSLPSPAATTTPGVKSSASPSVASSPAPSPVPTLGPNQIAILADDVAGSGNLTTPGDAVGNVHVFYRDGVMVGDRAHYDGDRFVTVSGHAYLANNEQDTKLYADTITFDTHTNKATLSNGRGDTPRGVETGRIYYTAKKITTLSSGVTHTQNATFSTCENPRGGYHIYAKSMDITPGKKLVAHRATVFLGGIAILVLPFLAIPLNKSTGGGRATLFAPEFGYDAIDGYYVKLRLGFGTEATYYGYYRVEEYSRRGLGLGYVAFIGRRDGRRQTNIDTYTFNGKNGAGRTDNFNVQDIENFSQRTRGQFGVTYTGNYGPYVSLPPSYSISGTVTHSGLLTADNYTFSRYAVGSEQSTLNGSFQDNRKLSPNVEQGVNLSYTENTNSYAGLSTPTSSLHINTVTQATSRAADYDFTIDKTEATTPSGVNKLPEIVIKPHGGRGVVPLTTQLTLGEYSEPSDPLATQRADLDANLGPALFKVFHTSDLSASFAGSQYYYGTGDEKAQTRQNVSLTTPISAHFNNVITYNEQNTSGPPALPFKYLDTLGGAAHTAQEVLRIFNAEIYTLTLSTATAFDHNSQPIQYQLTSRPSLRSALIVAGSYVPGAGNGFSTTNVQLATPFGHDQQIELTTNVDWKSRGRLRDKNIYFRKIIGNCYDIRAAYNEDLKAVNVTLDLLSFPSRTANFGFSTQQQAIFPQNFVAQ